MGNKAKISIWGWDSTGSAAVHRALTQAGLTVSESEPFEGDTQALLEALGELPDGSKWAVVAVTPDQPEAASAESEPEEVVAKPSGSLGHLGQKKLSLQMSEDLIPADGEGVEDGRPAAGWKRAVFEIQGEVISDKREDLPMNVEELAPFLDVLHSAGEQAVLKVPNGRKYSIWGWPDLQRPNSKVLAVGWGEPMCELIALHRAPVQTGTCIQEKGGMLPGYASDVKEVCEAVVGKAPPDTSGGVFAVQGDTVWIHRGNRVYQWDGRREVEAGTPKQAITSLALHWSNR
jgi:hypothetical protein